MNTTDTRELQYPERTRFFNGQLLSANDLMTEQNYVRYNLHLLNRMYRPGVIMLDGREDGLEVHWDTPQRVLVRPGAAIDPHGRLLVNPHETPVSIEGFHNTTITIAIRYREHGTGPAEYGPRADMTRMLEQPEIVAFPKHKGAAEDVVVLASMRIGATGVLEHFADERPFARLYIEERRPPPTVHGVVRGWMRLPFLPTPFAGGVKQRGDFKLLGSRAVAPAEGADGCMAIPVPPGATRIRQLRISGTSTGIVRVRLECISANLAVNKVLDTTLQPLANAQAPFSVDHHLGEDDALMLIVQTNAAAEIFFVAVEFS